MFTFKLMQLFSQGSVWQPWGIHVMEKKLGIWVSHCSPFKLLICSRAVTKFTLIQRTRSETKIESGFFLPFRPRQDRNTGTFFRNETLLLSHQNVYRPRIMYRVLMRRFWPGVWQSWYPKLLPHQINRPLVTKGQRKLSSCNIVQSS